MNSEINCYERNGVTIMQSVIRFSLFGNYERFSTSNLDSYMKLIEFLEKGDINRLQQTNYNCNLTVKLE